MRGRWALLTLRDRPLGPSRAIERGRTGLLGMAARVRAKQPRAGRARAMTGTHMNTPSTDDLRADVFLVRAGYAKSRTEAQSAIRSGRLRVNGEIVIKPSIVLDPE